MPKIIVIGQSDTYC